MSDVSTETPNETPDTVLGTRGSHDRAESVGRFVERFLASVGADVEHAIVDPEVDQRPCLDVDLSNAHVELGSIPSPMRLVFRPGPTALSTHLVTPASDIFQQLLGELRSHGHTTQVLLAAKHEPRDALPEVEEPDHLEGPPEVRSFVGVDIEVVVRVTFVAEERHEALIVVHAPVHGKALVVDQSIVRTAQEDGVIEASGTGFDASAEAVEEGLSRALTLAREWAHDAADPRQQVILEHLTRELQRLTHYFGELMAEHETEDALREELAADLDRRVSEEVAKHKLAIEFEPLACAIVGRPVCTFTYRDDDDDAWVYVYDRVSGDVWHETPSP